MERFKLYELVWVREESEHSTFGSFSYIGQVLSMRTPDDTYMVRRVPGHPGTLVEMPAAWLSKPASKYRHVAYALVRGRGQFPVDMLRYDNAAPVNFTIIDTVTGPKAKMLPGSENQTPLVAKAMSTKTGRAWTFARWSSFLWTCEPTLVEPIAND